LFALLSLFLLWPAGNTLGLVLAILGAGIWIGVQHLGYLEFGELKRVAQRTIEQRHICINNLAIRRAIEELKSARDYDQIGNVLRAAFDANDFDGFELRLNYSARRHDDSQYLLPRHRDLFWQKPGTPACSNELVSVWKVTLDLVTGRDRRQGVLTIYRLYSNRDLQLDINLLTSVFPFALADALDRVTNPVTTLVPARTELPQLAEAHAG
jgi:hypothetical protein